MDRVPLVVAVAIWLLILFYIYQIYFSDCPVVGYC